MQQRPPRPTARLMHAVHPVEENGNGHADPPESSTSGPHVAVVDMPPDVAITYLANQQKETREAVQRIEVGQRAIVQTLATDKRLSQDALLSMGSRVDLLEHRQAETASEMRSGFANLRSDLKSLLSAKMPSDDERVELAREAMALRARATVAEREAERARKEWARVQELEAKRASRDEETLRRHHDLELRRRELEIRQAELDAIAERDLKKKTRERVLKVGGSIALALLGGGGFLYALVMQQCGGGG